MTEYTSIKLPKPLAERIEKVIKYAGYRSVSEFVIDSVRRRLDNND